MLRPTWTKGLSEHYENVKSHNSLFSVSHTLILTFIYVCVMSGCVSSIVTSLARCLRLCKPEPR